MKPEEIKETLIGGTKNSVLRAASRVILEDMKPDSETEEGTIIKSIEEIAGISGMDKSLVASMIIHGFMTAFAKQLQGMQAMTSSGQKVGNC